MIKIELMLLISLCLCGLFPMPKTYVIKLLVVDVYCVSVLVLYM